MVEVMVGYRKGIDIDYYLTKHLPLAEQVMPLVGCERVVVRQFQPVGEKAPEYVVITTLYFKTMEAFQACMVHPAMAEAMEDVKNFYHGQPEFFLSQTLATVETGHESTDPVI
ncbi:MAG TPA: EthD family reductase [Symbiobacteriaceae bacterium]|nr:EthD family reductase [Symbiobacteriaceae bacterium]